MQAGVAGAVLVLPLSVELKENHELDFVDEVDEVDEEIAEELLVAEYESTVDNDKESTAKFDIAVV